MANSTRGFAYEWLVPMLMVAAPVGMKIADVIGGEPGRGEPARDLSSMGEAGVPELEEGKLGLHVIDVGQGDGIVVECPSGDVGVVVDSADNRDTKGLERFEAYVTELMDRDSDGRIELVLTTHPHSDHIGATRWLLETFSPTTYIDNGQKSDSRTYRELMAALSAAVEKGTRYVVVGPSDERYSICGEDGVVVEFLVPPGGYTSCSKPNDCSIVTRLDYESTSFILAGDAEEKVEERLLADPSLRERLDVDVLKAGHHGSDTSSTLEFLQAVSPRCIAVSVGDPGVGTNAGYKHPRLSTIETLNQLLQSSDPEPDWRAGTVQAYDAGNETWVDAPIREGLRLTPLDGDIVIESDGESIYCMSN